MMRLMKFDQVPLPIYKEVKGKDWVYYGENNDYPDYLLRLYNNSAKHNAIITGKVDYICGNGWSVECDDEMEKARGYSILDKVNSNSESLSELTKKITTDMILFGGYYLEVVWTKATGEISEINHLDYYKVRTNKDNTLFFYSDEWIKNGRINSRPEVIQYERFDPNNTQGKQILYYKEYRAGDNVYSLPDYRGAINYIELDISIGEYHLNSINNGMFSSKLINLNSGNVGQEEEDRIERMFKDKFSGSKNAGKFMLSFNDGKENEPSILDLSGTELDKHFDLLNKTTQQEILFGHKITSPMLFGVKTEGQLGGRSEMIEASELFQNTYVNTKQKAIEEVINYLYSFNDLTCELLLNKTEPISYEFSENVLIANMTQDEIRERLGLPQIEKTESAGSQDIINALNSLSPIIATKVVESMGVDELRRLIGLQPAENLILPAGVPPVLENQMSVKCSHSKNEEELMALFDNKGVPKDNYFHLSKDRMMFDSDSEFVKSHKFAEYTLDKLQENILKSIKDNSAITIKDLAKDNAVSANVITDSVNKLIDDGVIKEEIITKGNEIKVNRSITSKGEAAIKGVTPITSYKVLYSYEERPNVPDAISGSRPLCKKLYSSNLYFTRSEIQDISSQLGYSVFQLCGGWYRNPNTGVTTPYCRHEWVRNVVIEKTTR